MGQPADWVAALIYGGTRKVCLFLLATLVVFGCTETEYIDRIEYVDRVEYVDKIEYKDRVEYQTITEYVDTHCLVDGTQSHRWVGWWGLINDDIWDDLETGFVFREDGTWSDMFWSAWDEAWVVRDWSDSGIYTVTQDRYTILEYHNHDNVGAQIWGDEGGWELNGKFLTLFSGAEVIELQKVADE